MKTFNEWIDDAKVAKLFHEIATLTAELEMDDPEMVLREGFFGNLARAAGRGLGTMGRSAASAMGQMGQSAAAAGTQMRDAVSGPQARYDTALKALQGLSQELTSNQMLQGNVQSSQQTKELVSQLQGILKQLQQQQAQVQQLMSVSATAPQSQGAQVQMGAGAANPGAGTATPMGATGTAGP